MGSVAREVRGSLGGVLVGAAGSGLISATLRSIAAKAAANWIRKAISPDAAGGGAGPQPRTGPDSDIGPEADTSTDR